MHEQEKFKNVGIQCIKIYFLFDPSKIRENSTGRAADKSTLISLPKTNPLHFFVCEMFAGKSEKTPVLVTAQVSPS